MGTGHPCFGCTEEACGFKIPLHTQSEVVQITPAAAHAPIETEKGKGMSAGAAGVLGGVAGVAIGAGAVIAKRLGESDEGE